MATAKKSAAPVVAAETNELDDLLGDGPGLIPNADTVGVDEAKAAKEQEKLDKAKAKEEAKLLKDKERAEKKAAKEAEKAAKGPRVLKGEPVTFTNKAGEVITGYGQLYYVVRFKGKLHYKEASQVTVLDALPKAEDLTA